jgi:hypothetical protein
MPTIPRFYPDFAPPALRQDAGLTLRLTRTAYRQK